MALQLTDATTVLGTTFSTGTTGTYLIWCRRSSYTIASNPTICRYGSSIPRLIEWYSADYLRLDATAPDNQFSVTSGEWFYLAMVDTGNNKAIYAYTDVSAETVTTVRTSAYRPNTMDLFYVGDVNTIYNPGFQDMEFCYARAFTTALSTSQINDEKNRSTPGLGNVLYDIPLISSLAATTGNNFTAVTGSGYTWTANVPSSVGAASTPIARNSLRGLGSIGQGNGFGMSRF